MTMPHRPSMRGLLLVLAALTAAVTGCSRGLVRPGTTPSAISLEPPPGVAAPAHTLGTAVEATPPPPPSFTNVDSQQLSTALARSRDENQIIQDELSAVREQLASTSAQLAATRGVARPAGPPEASGSPQAGMAAAAMQAASSQLAVRDLSVRTDGPVVRIEIPAERLFDPGSAHLLPGGVAVLTEVASEIERIFPGHFLGIEGHVDTEPLTGGAWTSPHQLTSAQASAVLEFFISRTKLEEKQMFLVAHGANHPVVSNATAAGRLRNRRIELVIYPDRIGS